MSLLAGILQALFDWTHDMLLPMGPLGLFILAVIESIFFPVPVDVLLVILVAASPASWWWLALLAMVGSVLGAAVGYGIGRVGEIAVLERLFPKKYIAKAHALFQKYDSWAIFIGGFTPIPYKVFTIAAGVFYILFWPFLMMSVIARGLRFLLVAGLVAFLVRLDIAFSMALFNAVTVAVVLFVLEVYLARRIWWRRST